MDSAARVEVAAEMETQMEAASMLEKRHLQCLHAMICCYPCRQQYRS